MYDFIKIGTLAIYEQVNNSKLSHMTNKMADTKTISALLTGLARRRYYNESEYTDEFLKSQIFPDSSDEEYASLLRRCSNYMKVCDKTRCVTCQRRMPNAMIDFW